MLQAPRRTAVWAHQNQINDIAPFATAFPICQFSSENDTMKKQCSRHLANLSSSAAAEEGKRNPDFQK